MRLRLGRRQRTYSASAGLPFDDDELESRLVWIWACARSGSTWLLRLLSHPLGLVDSSLEPSDLLGFRVPEQWKGKLDVLPVDTTFVSNHLVPLTGGADYTESWAPASFSTALGLTNRPNYFFSSKYADAWRPELRRLMLVRFHRFIQRADERFPLSEPLVILKEVAGAHGADLVMSLFPRSRLIFLVRDGRDVVDSQTAANETGAWLPVDGGFRGTDERLEFVRKRCRTWVGDMTTIQRAYNAHPHGLRRTVKYEDLLADTAATLGPIVGWLGLRRSERWLERAVELNSFDAIPAKFKGPAKFFRSATPGAWRQNLTVDEQRVAGEVMAQKLADLNYSP